VEKLDEEVKSWQRAKQHWGAVLARVACAGAWDAAQLDAFKREGEMERVTVLDV